MNDAVEIDLTGVAELGGAADGGTVNLDAVDAGFELPAGAAFNDDGTITLTLGAAVPLRFMRNGSVVKEEVFSALTFRPLTGADLLALATESNKPLALVSRATGVTQPILSALFGKLDAREAGAVLECANFFVSSGQRKTGR